MSKSTPPSMSVAEFMQELRRTATTDPETKQFCEALEPVVMDIVIPRIDALKQRSPASPFPFSVTMREHNKTVARVITEAARTNNIWLCLNGIESKDVTRYIASGASFTLHRALGSDSAADDLRISIGGRREQHVSDYVELSNALKEAFEDMQYPSVDQPVEGARVLRLLSGSGRKEHLAYIIPYLVTDGGLALISDFGVSGVLQKDLFFQGRYACARCQSQCPREYVPQMNAFWCTACTEKFNDELDGEELDTTNDPLTISQAQARARQDAEYLHGPYHTAPCEAEYERPRKVLLCGKGPTVEWNGKFYCLQCWEESGDVPDTEIFPLGTRKTLKDEPCELVGWSGAAGWHRCNRKPAHYKRGLFHCRLCWANKFYSPFPDDASPPSSSSSSA